MNSKVGGLIALNTRMTVCELGDGGLLVLSPVALNAGLRAELESLGSVRGIVAPNLWHHLHLGSWLAAYPEAEFFAPTGLAAKRPDLPEARELGTSFDAIFGEDLLRIPIAGVPKVAESLFFHYASRTLVVTDFCFQMTEARGLTALYASLMGFRKKPGCPPIYRMAIKDEAAFRASLAPLRSLDISHLSMCHHGVLSNEPTASIAGILDRLGVD